MGPNRGREIIYSIFFLTSTAPNETKELSLSLSLYLLCTNSLTLLIQFGSFQSLCFLNLAKNWKFSITTTTIIFDDCGSAQKARYVSLNLQKQSMVSFPMQTPFSSSFFSVTVCWFSFWFYCNTHLIFSAYILYIICHSKEKSNWRKYRPRFLWLASFLHLSHHL